MFLVKHLCNINKDKKIYIYIHIYIEPQVNLKVKNHERNSHLLNKILGYNSGSQLGAIFLPKGHLAVSGDSFGCHKSGAGGTTGI